MLVRILVLLSVASQYFSYSIVGNNVTNAVEFSLESNEVASYEDSYVAAGRRQARWLYTEQKPAWTKLNQAFIDVVNKTSNKFPYIPFVVNVMCDPCIDRMGKFSCCFFISWYCCFNTTIEPVE